ncbi:MAG TPA: lipoyl(octanoyl) transferase LipB [Gemmataceae bacterium]|jgi:lipoyl(octanoyl) transferase|nr:lipoyl(octanoyl) transferase LipB [Gemmataceae bacterium]
MVRLAAATEPSLQVYLLGTVDFEDMLQAQRRIVYEVSGDRSRAALILCEHPPLISVGREGSREHIRIDPKDLSAREWPVRWVNRGGGCLLHLPGQLAVYPILPLDHLGLDLHGYLDRLHSVLLDVFSNMEVPAGVRPGQAGVWVHDRLLAHVGVAVRQWVTYFGAAVNVRPDLEHFKRVHVAGPDEPPMTSLARETRERVRDATVRQRLVEGFAQAFGFDRTSLFHAHPALIRPAAANAVAPTSR